ncbi:MAG: molybdopterin cofactor-binding domain-containing protein [Bauldia sp.]
MAYRLIGQNFLPTELTAKVTGRAKYTEDIRMDGMVFAKLLTSPVPHAKIKKIDVAAALKMPGVVGILTDNDITLHQDEPADPGYPFRPRSSRFWRVTKCSSSATRSGGGGRDQKLQAAEAIEAINIEFEVLPHVTDPLESLFPGGPNARSNGNVAGGQINLQTLKWDVADFVAAGDDKLPMGKPGDQWAVGDVDAALKNAKLVLDETWVTQGYSHQCMEPRSTFAYWQGNKAVVYASTQSQANSVPNVARIIGVARNELIYIAEFCGGGFGSKASSAPTPPSPSAHMSKKLNRPVMLRITRAEEYAMAGACRPSFQSRIKLGFDEKGRILAADVYIVQENRPFLGAGDFRAAGNCLSLVYQPVAMRWRALPVLTNTPPPGPQRGPARTSSPRLSNRSSRLQPSSASTALRFTEDQRAGYGSKLGADQG